ncbi:MAG: universal stress protein [Pseudomonadota bacterium]
MPDDDIAGRVTVMPRLRSIVTFVDDDPRSKVRLDTAIEIARMQDAHLEVLALRYDPNIPPYAFGDAAASTLMQALENSRAAAKAHAAEAQKAIEIAAIRGDAIPRVTLYRDIERKVAEAARFADLAIVSSPYGADVSSTASDILDGLLYDGDVPALVLPEDAADFDAGMILIGWDGSRQALKAVKGAMPLLQQAGKVEICVFDPQDDTPGETLATMLARHDVTVEIAVLPRPSGSIAEALSQRAREIGAGLLVMGAYGHSRFRESVIGGVTRDTLRDLSVPLLIAH